MAGLGLALGVSWLTLPATLASTHLPGTLSWAPVVAGLSIVVVGLIDAWRGLSRDDTTPTPAALLVKLTAGLAIATLAGGAVAVLIGHVLPQPPPYRLVIMVAATLLLGAILTAVAGAGDGVPQRGRAAVAFIMATVTVALAASAGRGNLDDRDDRRVERPSAAVTTVMPTPYPAGPRHPVLRPVPVELTPAPDAPEDVPLCHRRQLTAWTQGWDSAMYQTAVAVVVANWADEPCAVAGLPSISLRQGGQQLDIVVSHRSVMAPGRLERPRRALVTAGGHVSVLLVWDGYRNQADQSTPQDLLLVVPGVADLAVRLDQGPAPFDLVAGGRISVSAWR